MVEPEGNAMRLPGSIVLFALPFLMNAQPPLVIVHGRVLECDPVKPAGEFSIRTATNRVYRFSFDARTYTEEDERKSAIGALRPGDEVEIICDQAPESALRYARTVHIVVRKPPPAPLRTPMDRFRSYPYSGTLDDLMPRGNLTFSGIIRQLGDERLVLRTRADGDKVIYLRPDTRYVEDGARVQVSTLKPNTRVFVRAGTNLDNEIEAYQVVWGRILMPQNAP